MIDEIGKEGCWSERFFLLVAVLCMIPAALFVGRAARDLIQRSSISAEVLIGMVALALGAIAFSVWHTLERVRRPYRLSAGEYSSYRVLQARLNGSIDRSLVHENVALPYVDIAPRANGASHASLRHK